MKINHSHVLLDACCALNLYASGHFIEILESIPAQTVITQVVKERELLTLKRFEEDENMSASQFETAIKENVLSVVDFESDLEEETFVNYVFAMGDDGESATGAIAVHRNWAISTDDKRAISFFKKEAPQIQLISTLEMVKHWSQKTRLTPSKLRLVLHNIRVKGRYTPHKNHALIDWWEKSMRS
jgi:hypothetical protein